MSIQHQLAEAHRIAAGGLGKLCLIVVTGRGKKKEIEEIIEVLGKSKEILEAAYKEMSKPKSGSQPQQQLKSGP